MVSVPLFGSRGLGGIVFFWSCLVGLGRCLVVVVFGFLRGVGGWSSSLLFVSCGYFVDVLGLEGERSIRLSDVLGVPLYVGGKVVMARFFVCLASSAITWM